MDDWEPVRLRCSILFFRDDCVLLCRRVDEPDVWVLPGGTPRPGEATAAAARREVAEETGLDISAERIAFVLEATSWGGDFHLVEIVFAGAERDRQAAPEQREGALAPVFMPVDGLNQIGLRPPIAGYIRRYAQLRRAASDLHRSTAPYLGNVWRPAEHPPPRSGLGGRYNHRVT